MPFVLESTTATVAIARQWLSRFALTFSRTSSARSYSPSFFGHCYACIFFCVFVTSMAMSGTYSPFMGTPGVLSEGDRLKVFGVYAQRTFAPPIPHVVNGQTIGNSTNQHLIDEAVSPVICPVSVELSVPPMANRPRPEPTGIGLVDEPPHSLYDVTSGIRGVRLSGSPLSVIFPRICLNAFSIGISVCFDLLLIICVILAGVGTLLFDRFHTSILPFRRCV